MDATEVPSPAEAPRQVEAWGALLVVVSALCYSSLGIFGKVALGEGMDLPSLLALRFSLAAMVLWSVVLLSPGARRSVTAARARRAGLFWWGVFGLAGQAGLFFAALGRISASLSEVLLFTCPAFLALILWARTGRRPGGMTVAAIGLALAGTWLVAAPAWEGASAIGVGFGLGAGLWFASFMIWLDHASHGAGPLAPTLYIVSGAALTYALVLPFTGGFTPPATPAAWGAMAGLVVSPTLVALPLYVLGLRRIGPQPTAILSTFEPVGTLLLAYFFLEERLGAGQWLGAVLVLGAAFVLVVLGEPSGSAEPHVSEGALHIDPEPPPA
ncbi:MAG TPA: EamA family transporter [Candidatus Polarisedimenticolia bacterium]|nr:EamA family transporter [Candidatus Polarisedimenticolia bacterium]